MIPKLGENYSLQLQYVPEINFESKLTQSFDTQPAINNNDKSFTILYETDNKIIQFKNAIPYKTIAKCQDCKFKIRTKNMSFSKYQKSKLEKHFQENNNHSGINIEQNWRAQEKMETSKQQ